MPPELLDSQLAALEPLAPDERGLTVSGSGGAHDAARRIIEVLA